MTKHETNLNWEALYHITGQCLSKMQGHERQKLMCPKLKETKKKREQNATCVPGLKHEPEE